MAMEGLIRLGGELDEASRRREESSVCRLRRLAVAYAFDYKATLDCAGAEATTARQAPSRN